METPADPSPPAPPEPSAVPPPGPPAAASWPGWFGGVDAVLGVLAVLFAFLLASFVARNADLWLHLAAGRLLVDGGYSFGVDPFSYATAGRVWVNHAWLYDGSLYALYHAAGGPVVVAVKAVGVAVGAAALLLIRRRGQAGWPWAGCLTAGLLAMAPRMNLGPFVVSVAFLAVLLLLLLRCGGRAGSWRLPVLVGVLFAVWANVDEWFVVGPLAVALLLVGELAGRALGAGDETAAPDPLGPLPDVPTLAKTLSVGLLATLLNPHHVRGWDQLPVELTRPAVLAADRTFAELILTRPLDGVYSAEARHGKNANGAAYAILLAGGGALLGFGGGRVRLGHVALWIGFAGLSLWTAAAVPFFAAVTVPLAAAQLNSLSARFSASRGVVFLSGVGRLVTLFVLTGFLVATKPGWLRPGGGFAADAPRVGWDIEPDAALRKAAEQFERWRAAGRLPADLRGMHLSPPMANYCAWFAPAEKVFVNGRFAFHRPEMGDFLVVRANVTTRPADDVGPNPALIADVLARRGVNYVAVYDAGRRWTASVLQRLLGDPAHWSLWALDGRTGVFGWRPGRGAGPAAFTALAVDPVRLAYGPGQERLPPGRVTPPPPASPTWADDLIRPPPRPPAAADEALAWVQYRNFLGRRDEQREVQTEVALTLHGAGGGFGPVVGYAAAVRTDDAGAHARSFPLLTLRAARRAVADSPDYPDGYYALFQAATDPNLPIEDGVRPALVATACRQTLDRVPPPGDPPLPGSLAVPLETSIVLTEILNQLQASDLLYDELTRTVGYAEAAAAAPQAAPIAGPLAAGYKAKQEQVGKVVTRLRGQYRATEGQSPKLPVRYKKARELGLLGLALDLLRGADPDGGGAGLRKDFGDEWVRYALDGVEIELFTGRLEDADRHLAAVADEVRKAGPAAGRAGDPWPAIRRLAGMKCLLEGDYPAAGKLTAEELDAVRAAPAPPAPPTRARVTVEAAIAPLLVVQSGLGNLVAREAGAYRLNQVGAQFEQSLERPRRESQLIYHRGLMALYEGDIPAAREQFRQSDRPGPAGWNAVAREPLARLLVDLIDRAARPSP